MVSILVVGDCCDVASAVSKAMPWRDDPAHRYSEQALLVAPLCASNQRTTPSVIESEACRTSVIGI